MEGFDLSRSLHNAFAPIDNDAYKWQRIFDTKLQWQMQNEKAKNDLRLLKISDAGKKLDALSKLQYNIMPGPDNEYVQSVLAPLKDAVNEIYGGLMSGQDSEYYLEEAGKIFTVANNILNNDPRIKNSIAVSNVLQSEIGNISKDLQNKEKYDIDASRKFQEHINGLNSLYSQGKITLDEYLSKVRGFDTRELYTLSDIITEAKNLKVDSTTTQNDGLTGYGFQFVNEKVNDDKVFSLLRRAIERVGGKMDDVVRFVDNKGNPITIDQYNAIKDNNEKQKYKLSYITNAINCGNNTKCANVISSIIPVIPGSKSEQTYTKRAEQEMIGDREIRVETFKNQKSLDLAEYKARQETIQKKIDGLYGLLRTGLQPEKEAEVKAEIERLTKESMDLRKPTNELIVSDQDTEKGKNVEEAAFNGTRGNANPDNPMNKIMSNGLNNTINQRIDKNATKESIEASIINIFKFLYSDKHKYIGTKDKDGNIILNKDFKDKMHNLINEFLTQDKLKLYKDKNYSYKDIFDDLFPNIQQGTLRGLHNEVHSFFNMFGINNDVVGNHLHENILSQLIKDNVSELTQIFEKEDTEIVQISRFNQANPKVQRELTDFVKKHDNTIFSEKGGGRVDVSKIQNVEGIDYIGDKIYLRADIVDKDNKLKQVKLSVDSKSEETVFDQARTIMNAGDANNPVLSIAHPNYNRNNALSNTNYRTFKNISYANGFVNDLQRINRLPANKRKTLKLMSQDNITSKKNGNVTIEYTEGSMPMEISYNVNENNNTIKDLVKIRYFTYDKEGHKVYFNNGIYVNLLENKDNFDRILSHTHDSIKKLEDLRREWDKKDEEKNKNGNKSNSQ